MINQTIGPREDYANALLTITKSAKTSGRTSLQRYTLNFQIFRWRYFNPCQWNFNPKKLLALSSDPAAYGKALGKAVFSSKGLGAPFSEALAAVQARGDGLRIRLVIEPPELQEMLWERIYQPLAGEWLPLGSTAITPFSRFILPQQWDRPSPVTNRPLKVLVIISSPTDLESTYQLDEIQAVERQKLHVVLDQIPELSVRYLESGTATPPTLNEIRMRLAEGVDLVHFLCHGAQSPQGVGLFLEDKDGLVEVVEQARLVETFKLVKKPPVFCFLAACESAKRSRADATLPLGPALVEDGGIQAVVAMTGKVGLDTAQLFSGQFYIRLLQHGVVDLAMNEARALVQSQWDWGVPVLFSRLEDNQLIDFPISNISAAYLDHTDKAYLAMDEALAAARLEDHGQELVNDLQKLVEELGKSHSLLVDVASKFRRTGRDPKDFGEKYEAFYYDFKEYYDKKTWTEENTSCSRIGELKSRILPKLRPILDEKNFGALQIELDQLSQADQGLLMNFSAYLDTMNLAVEEIWAKLEADKIDGAIQSKKDFEAQISPSFQHSKEMFERMSHNIRGVSKA